MLLFPPAPAERVPVWRHPRLLGGILVVAFHVLLLAFLLSSMPHGALLTPAQREVFFLFKPQPPPARLPRKVEPAAPSRLAAPLFEYKPSPPPEAAIAPATPEANGLGLSLFRCGPESVGNLTPEERAHCSGALTTASLAGGGPSGVARAHSRDSGRWAAELAARNTPLQVPCTGVQQVTNNGITGQTGVAVMVNPLCAAGLLLNALDR